MNLAPLPAAPQAPASSVPAVPPKPARFTGEPRVFWRILARGAVGLAITLGIYRFWLATDVRRFLWAHTEIDGNSLEYTGTPLELLVGFLIAIAVLIPLNVFFFVIALGMGTVGEFASVIAFVVLAFLGQYAFFRARRYRLTRTVLRGVRFHQSGSAWRYAACALFWWLMIALTLGLAYPFAQASLERYKMRHTFYGDLPGRFEGSGLRLLVRGLWMWALVMGPLLIAIVAAIAGVNWAEIFAAMAVASDAAHFFTLLSGAPEGYYIAVAAVLILIPVSIVAAVLLFPVFQAMMLRWWVAGIRFRELTVDSRLRTTPVYGAFLRFVLYSVLFLIVAALSAAIAYGVFGALVPGASTAFWEIAGAVASVALYVLVMLGLSTIYQATVKLSLWRLAIESADIDGLAILEQVTAAGRPSSPVGEGLADALNVGGL